MLKRLHIELKILSTGLAQGERATGVQNIFYLKSLIKGHIIHQLGSLVDLAWIGPVGLSCLAGEFSSLSVGFQVRYTYSEHLLRSLSPCNGPVESIFNFS